MKNSILALTAFFALNMTAKAQCNTAIAPVPGHIKITTNQTLAAIGTIYWVCDGVDVIVSSSPGSVFLLEANATITFNGSSGDEVFAKTGCVITNNTADDIGVTVNPANVTLTNNGSGNIIITTSCSNVTYDYSLVGGSSGCATSITEGEKTEISIYPNPVNDIINLTATFTGEYSIYDIAGNLVKKETVSGTQSISVSNLSSGAYALFLNDTGFRFVK
ncbi:MAG: T9SS type A sorting domain-containing protein [Flavobacteriales bacterium]